MKELEKIRIPSDDVSIPEKGLGEYIDGYDSRKVQLWKKFSTIGTPAILLILGITIYDVVIGKNTDNIIYYSILGAVYILFMVGMYLYGISHPHVYFFYTNGFIRQQFNIKGNLTKQIEINYDEVEEITCQKKIQQVKGGYTGTSCKIIIKGRGDTILWKYNGSYLNEYDTKDEGDWQFYAYETLLNQWAKKTYERDMAKYGYVSMVENDRIVIGPNYFQKGDITIKKENIKAEFDGKYIHINNWKINFIEDIDQENLFLYALEKNLCIKR